MLSIVSFFALASSSHWPLPTIVFVCYSTQQRGVGGGGVKTICFSPFSSLSVVRRNLRLEFQRIAAQQTGVPLRLCWASVHGSYCSNIEPDGLTRGQNYSPWLWDRVSSDIGLLYRPASPCILAGRYGTTTLCCSWLSPKSGIKNSATKLFSTSILRECIEGCGGLRSASGDGTSVKYRRKMSNEKSDL
jgi:hypothetical protein